jgi:glycosyltransferase involved in cell wall biosynthesis
MNVSFFADFGSKNRAYTGGYYFAECMLNILRSLNVNLTVFSATIPKIDKGHSYVFGNDIKPVVLPVGGFGNPLVGLKWLYQLKKELKKLPKQDLYVFDQPMTIVNFLPQAPAIAMFHGSDFVKLQDLSIFHPRDLIYSIFWRKFFLNKIHKKFLSKEIGIPLFNSYDTLNRLCYDFNFDPHPLEKYLTYLPVDTEKFQRDNSARDKIRRQYQIPDDEIVIMALSNFDPVKRADRLSSIIIKTIAEIDPGNIYPPTHFNKKTNSTDSQGRNRLTAWSVNHLQNNLKMGGGVKFMLVGAGRMSKPIDELMGKSLIANRIIRIGEIPHNDVYKFYSAADIALSTSKRESFGYFIAEGMSCELPFIAYRGGAIEEVIEDARTGFVVDNENEFLERLTQLTENQDARKQMGIASRARIIKMFSMPVFKNRFLKILNEFII